MRNDNDAKREALIAKIKKLFALANNNPSEKEAVAAALKAQKLIADNDVSQSELHEEEEQQKVETLKTSMYEKWTIKLANVVATNFRCKHYFVKVHVHYGKCGYEQAFVGYECDAAAARTTFEALRAIANKLANEAVRAAIREYGTARGVRNSFLMGFVNGVRKELEKQSQALMLVCPAEVKQAFDQKKIKKASCKIPVHDADSFNSGYSAGRDAVRSGRMEGQLAIA